jgi:inositol-phosphate transport system substrate-binding protein
MLTRHLPRLLAATALTAALAVPAMAQETINLRAWTIGPDEASEPRATNLELAAERLNEQLEAEGADWRVAVEADFDTVGWEGYRRRVLLAFEAGDAPDIVQSAHVDVAAWSDAGFIAALDEDLDAHEEFGDVVEALWGAVTYRGQRWGVPQDTEARPLYFNKTLLGELGWSEEEIDSLPERVREGEFTWDDLIATAAEAVEAGVVEPGHGYWHRPINGPDIQQYLLIHGGETQDPETGKLVYDTEAGGNAFRMLREMVDKNVMSTDILGVPWPDFHRPTSTGKVLFWSGGTWNWADYVENYVADLGGEDYLFENIGMALQPPSAEVGRPLTLSQPQAYMVYANTPNREAAVRLLAAVTVPEVEVNHFARTRRPPVLRGSAELPEYQQSRFIQGITYMLDYTTFQPLHPSLGQYADILWRTVQAVEFGQLEPDAAAEIMAEELERALGDQVIIR